MTSHEASCVAWVARWATRRPDRPCLFYRGLLEWRWRSWAQMAEQASRIAVALAEKQSFGARIDLSPALNPDDLAVDLATQALGLEINLTTGASRNPTVEVPSRPVRTPVALDATHATTGGAWINGPDASGPLFLPADAQEAVADPVADTLPTLPGEPIVMVAGDRADPTIRAMFAWALREGAVLVLEPDLDALPESAVWTRPHVIVAPAAVLPTVRTALSAQPLRWRRLRAVLPAMSSLRDHVSTGGTVSTAEDTAWRDLGIIVAAPVADAVWRLSRRQIPEPAAN